MINNKQSSIEYLMQLAWEWNVDTRDGSHYIKFPKTAFEQAKAMHKNEIMDARTNGRWVCTEKYGEIRTNIQYYNETYDK